ncbi:helix-turn-helix domain-containing protein [Xenorhabdus bovienii]|uniref:helix-turn-helix domain-containing protein n=1 Tax=Xenorhabdus bovienii TaxID=40576 RepID=UPI0023B317E9|nr:LysR family transcriptional regulator [Xenorhabdus bovienii]
MLSTHEYANDLILFALIFDCGSFSKAAESAGITSLVISKRIGRLEKSLGNPQSCIGWVRYCNDSACHGV